MWQYPVSLICYLLAAAVVVFLSIKLSDFVDLLDKKTKISGAFLGGILLAAVTSLPELFTSLTATVALQENQYVMGNILGSDLFNICLFVIIYIFFLKKFLTTKMNKFYLLSLIFVFAMYICAIIGVYVFNANKILIGGVFNPISIVIFVIYAISLWKTPKVEENEDKNTDTKLTVKQIIILFIIFSILLIGASIGVTYLTNWVADVFKFGKGFAGALFLGVATSLPELTSTINLAKKKNFNAAAGNIIGSCIFNFIILSIADIFSFRAGPLYVSDQSTFLLIVCGIVAGIILFISILIKYKFKDVSIKSRIIYYVCSGLLLGTYITYLILSNINLNIPFAPFII